MTARKTVPTLTHRRLVAESMGHCMNPSCAEDLFVTGTFNGEMAHIKPHPDGGDITFDNLIILCRRCHKTVDDQRTSATEAMLLAWKADRLSEMQKRFTRLCANFDELQNLVEPILRANLQIFESYGPGDTIAMYEQKHAMWLKFEGALIANNQKLLNLLETNRNLLHKENQQIVDRLRIHTEEFVLTRENQPNQRVNLFPTELNSIFGIEQVAHQLAPNVSALQVLISKLIEQGRFIGLDLVGEQTLTYTDEDEIVCLSLGDRPRAQQTYRNFGCYWPVTTSVRLRSLVFIYQWLAKRRCRVETESRANLVEMTIRGRLTGKADVLFCEKYCVSVEDLIDMPTRSGLVVVNLHNWNGGPFSPQATSYAQAIGVRTMNQKEFFQFVQRGFQ